MTEKHCSFVTLYYRKIAYFTFGVILFEKLSPRPSVFTSSLSNFGSDESWKKSAKLQKNRPERVCNQNEIATIETLWLKRFFLNSALFCMAQRRAGVGINNRLEKWAGKMLSP